MQEDRRDFLKLAAAGLATAALDPRAALAQAPAASVGPEDRVFITNEDSNTIAVIDPRTNVLDTTINLTSFNEDPRPPFRFATGGIAPPHAAMIHKPLYHGCIDAHGCVPSPDGSYLATAGRGSSNLYLIDVRRKAVIGNSPNPQAGTDTSAMRLSNGVLLGREPHEPTFTRNGVELWVALRGEDRIAILDVKRTLKYLAEGGESPIIGFLPTVNGPAQVWFDPTGETAFIASQKESKVDVIRMDLGKGGYSRPDRLSLVDISGEDKPGFTPFLKTTPDGREVWFSHKLADALSARGTSHPFARLDLVPLGAMARPNHVEFVENAKGKVVYASLARVDDIASGVPSSRIAIIDRSVPPGDRKVIDTFFSHGREAHGLWTNPANDLLYVAHEQDELPHTPNAGQTCCSAFDVSDPLKPKFIAQIPLGMLLLPPAGELRNKKSINLVYVRPGFRGQTG